MSEEHARLLSVCLLVMFGIVVVSEVIVRCTL